MLVKACDGFISKNFLTIRHSEDFLDLPIGDIQDLIARDDIFVPSEEPIFESVLAWVQNDEINRKQYISQLLALVRLPLLKPQYIADRVASEGKELYNNDTKEK